MTVRDSHAVEQRVRTAVMAARREVREVKVHVHGQEDWEEDLTASDGKVKEIRTDFGREGC